MIILRVWIRILVGYDSLKQLSSAHNTIYNDTPDKATFMTFIAEYGRLLRGKKGKKILFRLYDVVITGHGEG